jgi:hypothetical protein
MYFCKPLKENIENQLKINANKGFLGMFPSLDYMHYMWKDRQVGWQG